MSVSFLIKFARLKKQNNEKYFSYNNNWSFNIFL